MTLSSAIIYLFPGAIASAWTAANPVLLKGELGMETDTMAFKFGDGVTAWNSLAYASSAAPVSKTAAVTIAAGQAVRPDNTGKLVLAQADTTNNAKGTMLAQTGAASTFNAQLAQDYLTLGSWTAALGSASLTPQTAYFLSPTTPGGITATVPTAAGQVVLHLGTAIDANTLQLSGSDPITL